MNYLAQSGYSLAKIVAFLPNVSSTRGIELRHLYWRKRPPVDSVLIKESEKKQYDSEAWSLVDTVYVFGNQSGEEKTSIAIGKFSWKLG